MEISSLKLEIKGPGEKLEAVTPYALTSTGFFYCPVTSDLKPEVCLKESQLEDSDMSDLSLSIKIVRVMARIYF